MSPQGPSGTSALKSISHRSIEWFGLEETFKGHLVTPVINAEIWLP